MAERGSYRRTLHEAAHKADDLDIALEPDGKARQPGPHKPKRIYHEAAHKLGYWGATEDDGEDPESEEAQRRFAELADYHRDVIADAGRFVLVLGALGVVYGDLG